MADLSYSLNFLNITYGDNDLTDDTAIRENPLFEMLSIEEYGGSSVEEKFYLSPPRGFSGDLTSAQQMAQTGAAGRLRWRHPFGRHVGSIQVDIEDVIQGRPDQAAADRALESEVDKGLQGEAQNLAERFMGRAGLSVGQGVYHEAAGATYPAHSLVFTDGSDTRYFQVNDQVVISATDSTSAGTLVGDTGFVFGRDVAVGYITLAALSDIDTAANPGSWVDGATYYVFKLGEYTDGDPDTIITSLERYLPDAVASDTLHNVDRSIDSSLSGARLPSGQEVGSSVQRSKRLLTFMQSRLGLKRTDMSATVVVYNSEDWGIAEEELSAKAGREVGKTTEEGYEAFTCRTAMGETKFLSDPGKRPGRAFILNTNLVKIYTASGRLFETIPDGSGNIVHLMPGVNTYEIRTISKPATGFGAPYMHGSHSTDVT